jgi:predicted molibdopterin-dependent oxidoreductase YjgC
VPDRLDHYRAPLSNIRSAKTVAVVCGTPVVELAPIVDLWLKSARRAGAQISYEEPQGAVDVLVTDDADCAERCEAIDVYYLPRTPNGRGVADAWSAAADGELTDAAPKLLIVSGDEAASDPAVLALAAEAETVIGIGMFEDSFRGLADLVLPAQSYLEREGTTVNLEGRLQRQRRAVPPPCPDELAWIAKLAERFDVALSPYTSVVFDEVSEKCFGGIGFAEIGVTASLPPKGEAPPRRVSDTPRASGTGLRLVAYKPLFSGAAVDRTPELQFQKAEPEVQIARADAQSRGIRNGQTVTVSSNGTSVELRARIADDLAAGTVRVARDHAADLHTNVEVR